MNDRPIGLIQRAAERLRQQQQPEFAVLPPAPVLAPVSEESILPPPVFDQDRHGVLDRPPSRTMTAEGI